MTSTGRRKSTQLARLTLRANWLLFSSRRDWPRNLKVKFPRCCHLMTIIFWQRSDDGQKKDVLQWSVTRSIGTICKLFGEARAVRCVGEQKGNSACEISLCIECWGVFFTCRIEFYFVLSGTNVTVNVCLPGVVNTDGLRNMPFKQNAFIRMSFAPIVWFLMKTAKDGAQTTLHAALADEEDGVSGKVFSWVPSFSPGIIRAQLWPDLFPVLASWQLLQRILRFRPFNTGVHLLGIARLCRSSFSQMCCVSFMNGALPNRHFWFLSNRDIHMVETDENAKNDEVEAKLWDLSLKMVENYLKKWASHSADITTARIWHHVPEQCVVAVCWCCVMECVVLPSGRWIQHSYSDELTDL